jgi:hypothetical protein
MIYTQRDLRRIYDRTTGYCHICRKKLALKNYGRLGARAAWEVEHSNPRACGGTDRYSNLYAACISCNRSKGAASTSCARREFGQTRAPLSRDNRASAKAGNAFAGGFWGLVAGAVLRLTPGGLIVTTVLGAIAGAQADPDEHRLAA